MRRLNLAYEIANNVGAYHKTGTQKHNENMVRESVVNLLSILAPGSIPASGAIKVLSGLVNTGAGSNYIISEGYILWQDPNEDLPEILYVPAATFTVSGGGNVAVICLSVASYTGNGSIGDIADPTGMTDNTTQNIHDIRTAVVQSGNSGTSGFILNYSGVSFVPDLSILDILATITTINTTLGALPIQYKVSQAIGSTLIADNTGLVPYVIATFAALPIYSNNMTVVINFNHVPSAAQAITLTISIIKNGSTVLYAVNVQEPNSGASLDRLVTVMKTVTALVPTDVITVAVTGTASGLNVTTVNQGEATMFCNDGHA